MRARCEDSLWSNVGYRTKQLAIAPYPHRVPLLSTGQSGANALATNDFQHLSSYPDTLLALLDYYL
jgi:hypothetical protein